MLGLERGIVEAPHWRAGDYLAIFGAEAESDAREDGTGSGVRRCLFVAEDVGDLLGFAVGSVWGDVGAGSSRGAAPRSWGQIESVAVAAGARRSGIGRGLCVAVVDWCRQRGADRVELEVRAGSGGAAMLYEDLGFCETGRRRGYYSDPAEDAVLMQFRLGGGAI